MDRSAIMRAVKSQDTSPEVAVRKLLIAMGYRYGLHAPSLPGAPDIVFPGGRKAIFVHGCFGMAIRASVVCEYQKQM